MFLGLELTWQLEGHLFVHQRSFVHSILKSHGFSMSSSKRLANISMEQPNSDSEPPTASELKLLQKYAGEFNWLATRTRLDIAYFTSPLANTCNLHGKWSFELAKKIHRYLLNTADQGLALSKLPLPVGGTQQLEDEEVWRSDQLVVWSDVGFGAVGTRSQTGVLVLWAGAPGLARSSREATSALSVCEAEVCPAATAWVCVEGSTCLLGE